MRRFVFFFIFLSRSTLQNYLKRHEGNDLKKREAANSNPFEKGELFWWWICCDPICCDYLRDSSSSLAFILKLYILSIDGRKKKYNYDLYVVLFAVAQEFGIPHADPAASTSQQPPQASSTVHILSLLLRLRQCCCHLSLLKKVQTELSSRMSGLEGRASYWVHKRLNLFSLCLRSDSWLIWASGGRDRPVPGGAAQCHVPQLQPLVLRPGPQSHRVPQWHALPLTFVWGHRFKH